MKREDIDAYARHEFELASLGVYDGELDAIPFEIAGATVLDLAAGPGIWCRYFLEAGAERVVWLDNSSLFAVHARNHLKGLSGVDYVLADMAAIPLRDESVDLVYCRGSLHHSSDEARTLREMYRILKPGGGVAFSAFLARRVTREVPWGWKKPLHYLTPYAALLLGKKVAPTLYHLRPVLEQNLARSGLEVLEIVKTDPMVLWVYARKPGRPAGSREEATARSDHPSATPRRLFLSRARSKGVAAAARHRVDYGAEGADLKESGSRPLVSVVIPTFNRARFCQAAVRTALAQTYRPIEVIVVDDGSTDETPRLFEHAPDEVVYIRQDNAERAAARNRGVAEARGDFVAFLDSDDFWSPRHLEIAVSMLLDYPQAALAFGRAMYVTESGIPIREAPSPNVGPGLISSRRAINAISRGFMSFPLSSVVARRSVVLEHRFNEDRALSRSEDWELWMRVSARYPVVSTRDLSTFIRVHGGNTSQEADRTAAAMRKAIESALSDPVAGEALCRYRPRLVASMELEVARLYAICGRKEKAAEMLRELEREYPHFLDRRALRRLRVMLRVPQSVAELLRGMTRMADIAVRYPSALSLVRELRAAGVDPRQEGFAVSALRA